MTGVFVVVTFLVLILAARAIKIVRPWQKGLIERLGEYQRTAETGLTLIFPFPERMIKVDMREQAVDVPPGARSPRTTSWSRLMPLSTTR